MLKKWLSKRLEERTTLDGVVLIAAGVVFLLFKPIATLGAYAAILYGIYTAGKSE